MHHIRIWLDLREPASKEGRKEGRDGKWRGEEMGGEEGKGKGVLAPQT